MHNFGHHGGNEPLQLRRPLPAHLEDLLVIGPLFAVVVHHNLVGDQGEGEDAHATVPSDDHLMGCAHAWRGKDRDKYKQL